MADERTFNAVMLNADGDDFGFETGSDEAFARSSEEFRRSSYRVDAVDSYIATLSRWEAGPEFAKNAEEVEQARSARLDVAREIADNPMLMSSEKLDDPLKSNGDPFKGDPREYLRSDIIYNDRPSPDSVKYFDFVNERKRLRDKLFGGGEIVSAQDYEKLARRTQGAIVRAKHIRDQYDLIDMRKEMALENYDNPRFVAEVAIASPSNGDRTSGCLDELLLDFDRKDLLAEHMGAASQPRSAAMAEVFTDSVHAVADKDGDGRVSATEKVSKFQDMRETGRNIRHNHLAVAKFAQDHSGPESALALNMGLAALDNTTFSRGLYDRWIDGLSRDEKKEILEKRSVATTYEIARKRFERDFDSGSSNIGESFAILEQAATQIVNDPQAERRLTQTGDIESVATLHMFKPGYKQKHLGNNAERRIDLAIREKMEARGKLVRDGKREGFAELKGKDGSDYKLDLKKAGKNARIKVVDGAHILISNSAEDAENGMGAIMRLDGILAPPPGTMTKSGAMDAGIEAKSHLEEVLNRHGVDSLGLKVKPLESGESVIKARLSTGEDLSQRMLRDGYALPVKTGRKDDRREHMAKQAEANRRGLWDEGFAEMDESWRRENSSPNLTWVDKKLRVAETAQKSMATRTQDVSLMLSRPEVKNFALPVKDWSKNSRIDDEIEKIVRRNPSRVMSVYDNNLEILKDLRKRKDKLSKTEKVAHDRLTMGNRALASNLMSKHLLDPSQAKKDDHPFMTGHGMKLSMNGVRPIAEATEDAGRRSLGAGLGSYKRIGSALAKGLDIAGS